MKPRPLILYLSYFGIAVVVFAVILFPASRAGMAVSSRFNDIFKPVPIRFTGQGANLSFPFALTFKQGELIWYEAVTSHLKAIKVGISIFSAFKTGKDISFHARLNNGDLDGSLQGLLPDTGEFSSLNMTLAHARVDGFAYETPRYKAVLSFEIDGRLEYNAGKQSISGESALMKFILELPPEILAGRMELPPIKFDRIDVKFSITGHILSVISCDAKGPAGSLSIKGSVPLKGRQPLALSGTFNPGPSIISKMGRNAAMAKMLQKYRQNGLPVSVSGSISNPNVRFN